MTEDKCFEEAIKSIPDHIWSSEPDVSMILSSVIHAMKAENVVETGVWYGRTSVSMVKALSDLKSRDGLDRRYTGIDVVDNRPLGVKSYMHSGSGVKCNMLIGSSLNEIKGLDSRSADLIFIDSVHELDYLREEFKLSERVIKQDGIIALHDSIHVKGVLDWVKYIKGFDWFEVVNMPTSEGRGLALIKCLCV